MELKNKNSKGCVSYNDLEIFRGVLKNEQTI